MSTATVNGAPISSGRITFRLRGTWDAELAVIADDADAVSGALEIVIGGSTLVATATRAQVDQGGTVTVYAVGGAGGLSTEAPALGYTNVTRRVVLVDALSVGGESLAASSSARLDESLAHWTRPRGTVADAVRLMAEHAGLSWRVMPSGSVWVGEESWPTVAPEHTVEAERPAADSLAISIESIGVLPGDTFRGQRVAEVQYTIGASDLRAVVSYGERTRGELADMLSAIVRREVPVDAITTFSARVVGQNADTSLELVPLDTRVPPMSRVPIRVGVAGVTRVEVPRGTTALVTHENGDRSRPVVVGFVAGAATLVRMGSEPQPLALAPAVEAYMTEATAFMTAARALLAVSGAVSGSTAMPAVPTVPSDLATTELEAT